MSGMSGDNASAYSEDSAPSMAMPTSWAQTVGRLKTRRKPDARCQIGRDKYLIEARISSFGDFFG